MKHEVRESLLDFAADPQDPATGSATFRFDGGLSVFAGHFPGLPLVPGVYLIEAARLTAEQLLGRALCIEEIHTARFTSEVHPGDRVRGRVALEPAATGWTCDARFELEAAEAARIRLILAPPEGG